MGANCGVGEENPSSDIKKDIKAQSIFDDLKDRYDFKDDESESGFGEYTRETQFWANVPHDQFSHAYGLINPSPKKIEKDGFGIIGDPSVLLGNIDNEKSLRLYQIDLFFLTNMLSCAIHDPMMKIVFEPLWTNFKSEVRITSIIGGGERAYQAFHVPITYGHKKGFKILGKRKKKREPIDYIIPNEDDEGIY